MPSFDIFDGTGIGNAEFFWLPPAAPNPDLGDSQFNADLTPVIDICVGRLAEGDHPEPHPDGEVEAHCPDPVISGGAARRVGSHYELQWKTPRNPPINVFTAFVRIEDVFLAHLHIVVTKQNGSLPQPGDYVVKQNNNANLQFHIGTEALCIELFEDYELGTGCTSESLPAGGSLVGGDVLVQLGDDDATITITDDCDTEWQLALPQIGACRFIADASLVDLDDAAVVCLLEGETNSALLPAAHPYHEEVRVVQFGVHGGTFEAEVLPPATCSTVLAQAPSTNPLARFAQAVWGFVGPEPLLASRAAVLHHGGGGSLFNFGSNFLVTLPLNIAIDQSWEQGQDALAGATLEPRALVSYFEQDVEDYVPYDGTFADVEVTFGANRGLIGAEDGTDGNEADAAVTALVGSDGTVAADWTLSDGTGAYSVDAYGAGIGVPDAFLDNGVIPTPITLPPAEITFLADAFDYVAEQGDNTYGINAYGNGGTTLSSFYQYGTVTGAGSSANTGLEIEQQSILFVYQASNASALVMIHDKAEPLTSGPPAAGGCVNFAFAGVPAGASFLVKDDPADTYTGSPPTLAEWKWHQANTDGGALGDLSASFDITITPDFIPNCSRIGPPGSISQWNLLSSGGVAQSLDMDLPLRIRGN